MSQIYDVEDFDLFNNKSILCITKLTQENIQVELFHSGDSKSKQYTINETRIMKFHYPAVMMVKGCNEIIIYSITEDMYYYIKLNSPILFESSGCISVYGLELRWYLDMGDYLAYAHFGFTVGLYSYVNCTFYTRYLEKSIFPDEKLLVGFERVITKFKSKEEEAYTLQFSNSLLSIGTSTNGLHQIWDFEYQLGEIILASCEYFIFWK